MADEPVKKDKRYRKHSTQISVTIPNRLLEPMNEFLTQVGTKVPRGAPSAYVSALIEADLEQRKLLPDLINQALQARGVHLKSPAVPARLGVTPEGADDGTS